MAWSMYVLHFGPKTFFFFYLVKAFMMQGFHIYIYKITDMSTGKGITGLTG